MRLYKYHIKLLKSILFIETKELKQYYYLQSFMKEDFWNLIIPKVRANKLNLPKILSIIKSSREDGFKFSMYIPEDLNRYYENYLETLRYKPSLSDVFVYKEIAHKYKLKLTKNEEIVEVDENNMAEYLELNLICFAGYTNQKQYLKRFAKFPEKIKGRVLKNFMIKKGNKYVSFGSIVFDKKKNIAYMHNSGTHPNFRHQGYFTTLKKYIMNYLLEQNISRVYAIVEENGGSYYALKKLGFESMEKFYIYSYN